VDDRYFGRKFRQERGFLNGCIPPTDHNDLLVLEKEPMNKLVSKKQLTVYRHKGFWQCMDTQRERDILEKMWKDDLAPWGRK